MTPPPVQPKKARWNARQWLVVTAWALAVLLVPILWFSHQRVRIRAEINSMQVAFALDPERSGYRGADLSDVFANRAFKSLSIEGFLPIVGRASSSRACAGPLLKPQAVKLEALVPDADLTVTGLDRLNLMLPKEAMLNLLAEAKPRLAILSIRSQGQPVQIRLGLNASGVLRCQQCSLNNALEPGPVCTKAWSSAVEVRGGSIMRLALPIPDGAVSPTAVRVPIRRPSFNKLQNTLGPDSLTQKSLSGVQQAQITLLDFPGRNVKLAPGKQLLFSDDAQLHLTSLGFGDTVQVVLEGSVGSMRAEVADELEELVPNLLLQLSESKPWVPLATMFALVLAAAASVLDWLKRFKENA
jgi:hypothetical protein